jgi:hypothetical protein
MGSRVMSARCEVRWFALFSFFSVIFSSLFPFFSTEVKRAAYIFSAGE